MNNAHNRSDNHGATKKNVVNTLGTGNVSRGVSSGDALVFYAVMVTIILKTTAFIPLLHDIMKTGITENISWLMLTMNLVVAVLLIAVTSTKNMYPQMIMFIIYFTSIVLIMMFKSKNEGFDFWGTENQKIDIRDYTLVEQRSRIDTTSS